VDEDDGHVSGALELSEAGQDGRDRTRVILVLGMKADEGVEEQQAWANFLHGSVKSSTVFLTIEAKGGSGDEVEVGLMQTDSAVLTEPLDARPSVVEGVLGQVEQSGAGLVDCEGTQAGSARGDAEGEIEGEPGLADLGLCGAPHNPSNGAHPVMWSGRRKLLTAKSLTEEDSP